MEKHRPITLLRVQHFKEEIRRRLYPQRTSVGLAHYAASGRIRYEEAAAGEYQPITLGTRLKPLWSTHWFRVTGEIPEAWAGEEIHFLWDSSSEALVWQDGEPKQGMTGSSSGWDDAPLRTAFPLRAKAAAGERVQLMVEAAMNGLFGISAEHPRKNEGIGWLRQAELAVFDRLVWDLLWDFTVIADMATELPENSPRGGQALYTANAMVNRIDWQDRLSLRAARTLAAEFLSQTNGGGVHQLSVIGHAHIDTAWLWPLAETKRKCARTFSSVLQLMDLYPDFLFVCSQPQQLAWMKESYPGLYARISEKIREKRFIPTGATWVEPDTNIPSGESLVRQFLYGQRFFMEEYGEISRVFWEPDVFGYAAALPQIMRQAGVEYFLTQKLSWNEFNKPDRHTFLWEGLDGSRVLAHFPPVDTYNSLGNVHDVLFNVANFKDHERASESYLLFGYGDGGGGPTAEMIEQLARMQDVNGLPKISYRPPEKFFDRCQVDLQSPTVLAGELYFENHRGTYTTQADIKRDNRRCEELLHDAELLAAWAMIAKGEAYPHEELRQLWQQVLTNQFHDILPGSSIAEVYEDARETYQGVMETVNELKSRSLTVLLEEGMDDDTLINTTASSRLEVISLPTGMDGQQHGENGEALGVVRIAAYSMVPIKEAVVEEVRSVSVQEENGSFILENETVRVRIDQDGRVTEMLEKNSGRQVMETGESGNCLMLYDDYPTEYDAWNVDITYREKGCEIPAAEHAMIVESGPLRAAVRIRRPISQRSYLVQTISLSAVSPLLSFDTQVSWQEEHRFLRVLFPLALRAQATSYEVQFGMLQRPTHSNTRYDLAQFEVCAQRWADLSEPDFGAALLNDSKYGYACQGNVLSLSLLRAPTIPDPAADRGEHRFRYGLLPHALTPQLAAVWSPAMAFNHPLTTARGLPGTKEKTLLRVNAPNIVLDTVKAAEDNKGLIVRLYEATGSRTQTELRTGIDFEAAFFCDLLEREVQPVEIHEAGMNLEFKPFEIKTLLFKEPRMKSR